MDVKDLPQIVLLFTFIGMITGVGIITLLGIGDAGRYTWSTYNENYTFINGTAQALANTQVRTNTVVVSQEGTALTLDTDYLLTTSGATSSVTVINNGTYNNTQLNVTYDYYQDSDATAAMDNIDTAISTIPNTWMALIVTIVSLSIILVLVIKSFNQAR